MALNRYLERETTAWWVLGTLGVTTLALTAVVDLSLSEAAARWSGLGMLLWIGFAALCIAGCFARAGLDRFWSCALRIYAMLGWVALIMCALRWNLLFFRPNSNMFTMLFPVTGPIVFRPLFRRGRIKYAGASRLALRTISLVAVVHLVWFFPATEPATRLFMAALAIVSFLAARHPRPMRTRPRYVEAVEAAG